MVGPVEKLAAVIYYSLECCGTDVFGGRSELHRFVYKMKEQQPELFADFTFTQYPSEFSREVEEALDILLNTQVIVPYDGLTRYHLTPEGKRYLEEKMLERIPVEILEEIKETTYRLIETGESEGFP